MNNKFSIVLLMQIISFCISITANAQTFTSGEFTYKVISASERTVQITDFNQTSTNSYVSNRLIRIPSGVSKDGIYFTVTEISYLFSSLDDNIKTLIIPSTIKKLGSSFNPYFADEVFLLTDTPPEGYDILRSVKNLYIIGGDDFPFGTEMVSVISGQEKVYDGAVPHFSFFNNLIGISKVTITEPYNSSYLSNAGTHSTSIRYEFTLDNNKNVPGYSDYVTYDPTIVCYKKFEYTISPKTLIVNCNNEECEYGNECPNFTYSSVTGFVNNESLEKLGANITLTSNYSVGKDTGEYPIIADINNGNYNCTSNGKLIVKKAPLIVIPNNAERKYGEDNPTFQLNCFGLRCNDLISDAFSLAPTVNTSASKNSDVGTYSIIAQGGISQNYIVSEYKEGVITITKAPLTLAAANAERVYYEPNPQFTYTLEGLRNNDTKDCLSKQPVFECAATLSSDCGKYDITPSSADALNYNISYKPSVLTITPAPLTVKASDITREYGEENPILKYELIGLKGNDNVDNAIQEQPSLNTNATSASNVGEYSIVVNGGASNNYTLSYRNGILSVTKAPLSVVAENAERVYGDANPTFVRSYLGFKLNDTESTAFSVLPHLSCSATRSSNVGEYPISISGGTCKNYEIKSYDNGILTIKKATALLTPTDKNRLYFEDNPQFDFTISGLRNNDTKDCLTTLPKYTCAATKLSDAGTYPIIASNAQATNYNFEYGQGLLTIDQRELQASVGDYTRAYGEENPSFDISYSGFVNNEDSSVLSQLPSAICSANKASDVGTYPITVSGGDAVNYYFSKYNSGVLSIEKAEQSITWNQDLSSIELYSQIELNAASSAGLPVTYEMSPNNVATLYSNAGKWYLDCYGSGAVNIRAVQTGDKNHNAANMVSKTLIVYGSGDDPSNPQIYLNIEEPGTLSTMVADNRKYQIKNLRLTGYLNGTDINFLREMSGSDSNGNTTPGILETLDISGCTIVEGGRSYYKSSRTSDYVVGDYMFYNCKVLTTLHLPNNSTHIGDCAFADCERLSVISIPNSVKQLGIEAFRNDISLLRIPMPNALTAIGDMAFMGCNGLTELTIPAEVSSIGDGIVKDCQNIARINVEVGNSHYASVNGVLFNNSLEELIIFPINHSSKEYVVANGVKTIAPYAFVNAKGLKIVTLPPTLNTIGENAFIGCVDLQTLKVLAITPPVCENDCFESVSKTRCELQVPIGCRSSYWVAPVWSDFNKITEIDFSGINDAVYDNLQVTTDNGKILISGCPSNLMVRIFNVDGTLLYSQEVLNDEVTFEPSTPGVFLVVVGNHTYKLLLSR